MRLYVAHSDGIRRKVPCYAQMHFCEDLTLLTKSNIIPMFMNLYLKLADLTPAAFESNFRTLELVMLQQSQPQDASYDSVLPAIFLYIASFIPKNPTKSLANFMLNREVGLIRFIKDFGLSPSPGQYVFNKGCLEPLRDLLNNNTDLMADVYNWFLAYANPEASVRTSTYSYARELLGQLKYVGMGAVKILEENIIATNHPCLSNTRVLGYMRVYHKFVVEAKSKHDDLWIYAGLIDKELWLGYSKSLPMINLMIIAIMFAGDDQPSFLNIRVNRSEIGWWKTQTPFSELYSAYNTNRHQLFTVKNTYNPHEMTDVLAENIKTWIQSDRVTNN